MKAMLGMDISRERLSTATLGSDLGANDERQDYLRAQLYYDDSGNAVATPFSRQDSSMMARLAEADCLVVRLPGAPALKAGHKVEIMPIGGGLVQI
jgi:molybdopterin molybdotransferase